LTMRDAGALNTYAANESYTVPEEPPSGQQRESKGSGSGSIPKCCSCCGYYKPQMWTLLGRDCAAFGTIDGVKNDRCGMWNPR